jgi:hypothetical protein
MAQKNQASIRPIFKVPSREDYFGFLIRCNFGDGEDSPQLCVRKAYLDLNRTLHGFAVHKRSEELRNSEHLVVARLVAALPTLSASQRSFDHWHRKACSDIREHYLKSSRFAGKDIDEWIRDHTSSGEEDNSHKRPLGRIHND